MMRQEGLQEEGQALLPGRCDSDSAGMVEARGTHCFFYPFLTPSKSNWFSLVACLFVCLTFCILWIQFLLQYGLNLH